MSKVQALSKMSLFSFANIRKDLHPDLAQAPSTKQVKINVSSERTSNGSAFGKQSTMGANQASPRTTKHSFMIGNGGDAGGGSLLDQHQMLA